MTTMSVVGECFFWYRLTRVVPDNFHRAIKWLCVCVCEIGVSGPVGSARGQLWGANTASMYLVCTSSELVS